MINFKAEKYGIEPNVTGIEEEINLAYLDGERENRYENAKGFIELGADDEIIAEGTGLGPDEVQKLRSQITF